MTPYAIFAIALTIAYIIYYGYNISKDLYGKKGDVRDTAEEFDIASMTGEVIATPVRRWTVASPLAVWMNAIL